MRAGCVVTIFVNPTQFNEKDDYARYPRTLEADLEKCRFAGAAVVLAPEAEDVYPPGAPPPMPALPREAVEPGLEDAARPGHFGGVCQVVARLFDMVRPGVAVFGEKDWQQLRVVAAMVRRERWPIEVVGAPTVREADGLAMSSRNIFLSAEDRVRALALSRGIALAGRESAELGAEATLRAVLREQGITPDYAVVRDAETLMPLRYGDGIGRPRRALVAARVGPVRLLDNGGWPIQDPNMKIGS